MSVGIVGVVFFMKMFSLEIGSLAKSTKQKIFYILLSSKECFGLALSQTARPKPINFLKST